MVYPQLVHFQLFLTEGRCLSSNRTYRTGHFRCDLTVNWNSIVPSTWTPERSGLYRFCNTILLVAQAVIKNVTRFHSNGKLLFFMFRVLRSQTCLYHLPLCVFLRREFMRSPECVRLDNDSITNYNYNPYLAQPFVSIYSIIETNFERFKNFRYEDFRAFLMNLTIWYCNHVYIITYLVKF